MSIEIPNVTLNNGHTIPIFGLGTWKSEPGKVTQAVKDAIDAGYRHIDCALVYQNEKEVGEGINQKIQEGVVKREDLFVTSKLWNTYHRRDLVLPALQKSLDDLSFKYLDLYLIHWPMAYKDGDDLSPKDDKGKTIYSDSCYLDAWQGLEECVEKGLVKSIGVSNFNSKQIEDILKIAKIKPVVNQVECHPYLNQHKLKAFCEERGIKIEAYSPLGSQDRPWASKDEPVLMDDPKLAEIAAKYKKSVAQILIRYQIDREVIVIPKSVTKSRIVSNIDVFDFKLSPEDMEAINALDRGLRFSHSEWDRHHKDYPFGIEF